MVQKQDEQRDESQKIAHTELIEEETSVVSEQELPTPTSAKAVQTTKNTGHVRNAFALIIAVIVIILITVSVPALWLRTTVVDADQWAATVAPLADSPAIQKAVSANVSSAIINALDMQGIAEQYLPEKALPLAAPIVSAMESMIEQQTSSLVASSQFSALWSTVSSSGHTALIAVLSGTDNGGAISSANGAITLDTGVVIEAVKQALVERGFKFVADIPTSYLDKKIVLYSSPLLVQAQSAFSLLQNGTSALVLITLVLTAAAVALGKNRRKVILWIGMGTFMSMLVSVLVISLAKDPLIGSLTSLDATGKAAAAAAYDLILSSLVQEQRIIALVGLFIGIVTIIVGRPVIRARIDQGFGYIAAHDGFGTFCQWISKRQRGFFGGGFIVAGVILLFSFSGTWSFLTTLVIVLIIWLLLVSGIVYLAHLTDKVRAAEMSQHPQTAETPTDENPSDGEE